MQNLQGLSLADFEKKANIILGKVEVDKDGTGNFVELEDVISFDVQSTITNLFLKTCAKSFSIELLNTGDRYSFFDTGKSKYNWIREGRKIRLYVGIYAGIPRIEENTETISCDADDGVLIGGDFLYSTTREKTNADIIVSEDTMLVIGQLLDFGMYEIYRGGLFFDTSIIPEGATITKAILKLYDGGMTSISTDFDLIIQNGGNYPNKPLVVSDYNYILYSGNGGSINTSNWLTDEYNEIELNEDGKSWINKGGITRLILRSSADINGIAPTGIDMLAICSQEHETENQRPILYIEYESEGEVIYNNYYWNWIHGIIDKATTQYDASSEICSISGRDYIAYLSENYLKNLWWGKQQKYSIIADKEKYNMPSDCRGIYKVYKYNNATQEYGEIVLNSEYTYDWEKNQFVFLHPNVPYESEGNIWVWYFTAQTVENVVADLLIEAGLLTHSGKQNWLSSNLVTPTGKTVDRCWFESGTTYMHAIELLAERVIYRFKVNNSGQPMFTRIPVLLTDTAKRLNHGEYIVRNIEERLDELYNHFILEGEKRAMKKINLGVMANGVENITHNSATLVGTVLADGETSGKHWKLFGGNSIITQKGFKWKTGEEAEQSWYTIDSDMGIFEYSINILDPETRYEWLVWAKNSLGHYAESNWNTFVTLAEAVE